jgi:hypothetical protein
MEAPCVICKRNDVRMTTGISRARRQYPGEGPAFGPALTHLLFATRRRRIVSFDDPGPARSRKSVLEVCFETKVVRPELAELGGVFELPFELARHSKTNGIADLPLVNLPDNGVLPCLFFENVAGAAHFFFQTVYRLAAVFQASTHFPSRIPDRRTPNRVRDAAYHDRFSGDQTFERLVLGAQKALDDRSSQTS